MNAIFYLAAGNGKRLKNKLFLPINGRPVFEHGLEILRNFAAQQKEKWEIFINCRKTDADMIRKVLRRTGSSNMRVLIAPGQTRHQSVWNIMEFLQTRKQKPEILIVHNAANPFVASEEIEKCVKFLKKHNKFSGVGAGKPVTGTLKSVVGKEIRTIPREGVWTMETPQAVRFRDFWDAHRKAKKAGMEMTDDLAVLEWAGYKTAALPASFMNFKITTRQDYEAAKVFAGDLSRFSFGYGEDSHAFSPIKKGLRLGGLLLRNLPKFEADSDGDVVLHAITAACLQAFKWKNRGSSSLGKFTTPIFQKGVHQSSGYLKKILYIISKKNLRIEKINIVLEGSSPKIDPLAPALLRSLSRILYVFENQISLSAHTGEKLTPFGEGKGLRCAVFIILVSTYGNPTREYLLRER